MARIAALLNTLLLAAACGGGVVQRRGELPPAPPGQGFVEIRCAPPDVDIYVDDHFQGRLDGYPQGVLRLGRGPHRLALQKSGFSAWYGEIEVTEETPVKLETHLVATVPEPDEAAP